MGDIARCSLKNEELLYKLFGVNAEFLIDHAWGWEPCTIKEIKAYKPSTNSSYSQNNNILLHHHSNYLLYSTHFQPIIYLVNKS